MQHCHAATDSATLKKLTRAVGSKPNDGCCQWTAQRSGIQPKPPKSKVMTAIVRIAPPKRMTVCRTSVTTTALNPPIDVYATVITAIAIPISGAVDGSRPITGTNTMDDVVWMIRAIQSRRMRRKKNAPSVRTPSPNLASRIWCAVVTGCCMTSGITYRPMRKAATGSPASWARIIGPCRTSSPGMPR